MVDKLATWILLLHVGLDHGLAPGPWLGHGPWPPCLSSNPPDLHPDSIQSFVFPSIMESCFEFSASLLRFVFNTFKFKEQQLGVLQAIIFLTAHPLLVNFSD